MAARLLLPLLLLGLTGGSADPCRLPALPGRCRASIPRWFFNSSSGSCEQFVFGGCGGNRNNFGTERDCRRSFALRRKSKPSGSSGIGEDRQSLMKDPFPA